ncbi:MAG: hypothetical protein MZV65_39920 [Chromatiales bacterium]|nr:hypothetical protein [Chromatiales bacterium]
MSAMAGSAGSVPGPGVAHCVCVEDGASLPARGAALPREARRGRCRRSEAKDDFRHGSDRARCASEEAPEPSA